jgi:hypothetical protein
MATSQSRGAEDRGNRRSLKAQVCHVSAHQRTLGTEIHMSTGATHREIGVGLISVGWMGRLHTRAYKAVAEHYPELGLRARLVIAADTVEASARQAAEVLGYQSWTLDYHDVLTHPDVDVVSICAPNFLHKQMALAAVKAGKPFWIEKPMGRGAAESGEIARAAQDAGLVTSVGFNYRQAPAVQHARELISWWPPRPPHQRSVLAPGGLLRRPVRCADLALRKGTGWHRSPGRPGLARLRPGTVPRRGDHGGDGADQDDHHRASQVSR